MSVLIYGFYNKNNIGDDLFKKCFELLFPNNTLLFTDHINLDLLQNNDTVVFGAGSILDGEIALSDQEIQLLLTKRIFYIGVGSETEISSFHKQILPKAELVISRSINFNNLLRYNPYTMYMDDLVYLLKDRAKFSVKIKKSILWIPNIFIVPKNTDPYWMHSSWDHFKTEMSQSLDVLVNNGYIIDYFCMQNDKKYNDNNCAIEILNRCNSSDLLNKVESNRSFENITQLFSSYDIILSQRLHGSIISDIVNTKHIAIYHHDKMKVNNKHSVLIDYYSFNKNKLLETINNFKSQ